MSQAILCLSCEYNLVATGSGRCPECGQQFDPGDPSTFATHRRRSQAIRGIVLAIGLGGAAYGLLRWSWDWPYGNSHSAAFLSILGIGATLGVIAALSAARNRSWLGRIPLLLMGTLCVWAGLFFASEKYYRVWQASPDPPNEAYADTGPLGALLGGWVPGGLLVGAVFGAGVVFFAWHRRGGRRSIHHPGPPPPPTKTTPRST